MFQELTGNLLNDSLSGQPITCGSYCYTFCQSVCDDEYPLATNRTFEYAEVYALIEG